VKALIRATLVVRDGGLELSKQQRRPCRILEWLAAFLFGLHCCGGKVCLRLKLGDDMDFTEDDPALEIALVSAFCALLFPARCTGHECSRRPPSLYRSACSTIARCEFQRIRAAVPALFGSHFSETADRLAELAGCRSPGVIPKVAPATSSLRASPLPRRQWTSRRWWALS
jgi:hypothetical protein